MRVENSSKHFVSTCTHVNFVNIVLFAVKKRRTILLDAVATFPCLHMIQTAICLLHRVCCCQGWVKHFSACALSTFIKCLTVLQTLDRIEALCLCLYLSTCFKCVNA